LADRASFVQHVRSSREVVAKDDWIVSQARGRRVLDLGCIDHSAETALTLGEAWLHRRLKREASELVGVDQLADDAEQLRVLGYEIVVTDVEHFDLGRRFDLIVAGDLIEHLSNPGHFLESVATHLADDGRVILTTPNAFNAEQFALAIVREEIRVNIEHVLWFDPQTLYTLVERSPLAVSEFRWLDTRFHFSVGGRRIVRTIVDGIVARAMQRRPILGRDFALVLQHRVR
jgi:SAM-dependent methyltransferase